MNYAAIDLASLSWVLPELDSTFKTVRKHLLNAYLELSDNAAHINHLTAAKHVIHDAVGALNVIDAQGLVQYVAYIEQAIECYSTQKISLDENAYQILNESCYALMAYLNELHTNGIALQPLHLFAYHAAIYQLITPQDTEPSGGIAIHPVDLYFPALTPRLKRAENVPLSASALALGLNHGDTIDYLKLRSTYESLVLQVFTDRATNKDIAGLVAVMRLLAHYTTHIYTYSFWKTCEAVMLIVLRTPSNHRKWLKRWLAQLNIQIQRLGTGSNHVSERLFREALYFIALDVQRYIAKNDGNDNESDTFNTLQIEIFNTFNLRHSVPLDLYTPRYSKAVSVDTVALLHKINILKLAWDEASPAPTESEGIEISKDALQRRLGIARDYALGLFNLLNNQHLTAFANVVQALIQASNTLFEGNKILHKGLGLEGAKAILWVEENLKKSGQVNVTLQTQAQEYCERLASSIVENAILPNRSESFASVDRALLTQVVREAMVSLSTIEKQLDISFETGLKAGNLGKLSTVIAPLTQVSSTLNLLGLPEAAKSLNAIQVRLTDFINHNQVLTSEIVLAFAMQFSQTTNLLDLFTRAPERAQHDFVFDIATEQLVNIHAIEATTQDTQENEALNLDIFNQQREANVKKELQRLVKVKEADNLTIQTPLPLLQVEPLLEPAPSLGLQESFEVKVNFEDFLKPSTLSTIDIEDTVNNDVIILTEPSSDISEGLSNKQNKPIESIDNIDEITISFDAIDFIGDITVNFFESEKIGIDVVNNNINNTIDIDVDTPIVSEVESNFRVDSVNSIESFNDELLVQTEEVFSSKSVSYIPSEPVINHENELYEIFIEEGREVLVNTLHTLHGLEETPESTTLLADARRSFHTLKGSARMVGFKAFGDAAWQVEHTINDAVSKQAPVSNDLIQLMRCAQEALTVWLHELNDGLVTQGVTQFSQTDFAVNSTLASFEHMLAPYLYAIEHPNADDDLSFDNLLMPLGLTEPSETTEVVAVVPEEFSESVEINHTSEILSPSKLTPIDSDNYSTVVNNNIDVDTNKINDDNYINSISDDISVDSDGILNPIQSAANLEASKAHEFIIKARQAVLQARASKRYQLPEVTEMVALQPVQIMPTEPIDALPAMIAIGPLRLPKQLFSLYVQETQQHLQGLRSDLTAYAHAYGVNVDSDHISDINNIAKVAEPTPTNYLLSAYQHAHSLKGSAATVGMNSIKEVITPLEQALQCAHAGKVPLSSSHLSVLSIALSGLEQDLDAFSREIYPDVRLNTVNALTELWLYLNEQARIIHSEVLLPESSPNLSGNISTAVDYHHDIKIDANTTNRVDNELNNAKNIDKNIVIDEVIVANNSNISVAAIENINKYIYNNNKNNTNYNNDNDTVGIGIESNADEIDPDIWQGFLEEAETLMPSAQAALSLAANDTAAINTLRRDLHTLKGSSRMAGAMRLGAMVHTLESKLEANLLPYPPFLSLEIHESLLGDYDAINALYENLKNPTPMAVPELAAKSDSESEFHSLIQMPTITPLQDLGLGLALPQITTPSHINTSTNFVSNDLPRTVNTVGVGLASSSSIPINSINSQSSNLPTLRIRMDILDALVNQATEVSSSKGRLDQHVAQLRLSLTDLTDNVDRLRQQLRALEIQGETQMTARTDLSGSASEFDPLEFDRFTRFQELTRMLAESMGDLLSVRDTVAKTLTDAEHDLIQQTKSTKELTQSLMRSRLVAFDILADRLYRVVRQTAKELNKQVNLDLIGGHLTLDRSILEKISSGLEHLVRNSVVHGIEIPEVRLAANKPAQGTITLTITQQGNELEIILSDNGAGLALNKIQELAISKGLLNPQAQPTTAQLAEFIFAPGFSTADNITELAGRGIGMDVVRSDIMGLGGRITIATLPQHSTTFNLRIPLTLALNQVLMVMAQTMQYAIPMALIQSVVSVKPSDLAQAYSQGQLTQRGTLYPFAHLSDLMGTPTTASAQTKTSLVVLLSNGSNVAAVHVDNVLGNVEAVVKPLSPFMRRIPGLSSATLLGDGQLCLILDPVQLLLAKGLNITPKVSDIVPNLQAFTSVDEIELGSIYALNKQLPQLGDAPFTSTAPVIPTVNNTVITVTDNITTSNTHLTKTGINNIEQFSSPLKLNNRLVMVVDDSITVRKVTEKLLLREGWEVVLAKDGIDALEQLQKIQPVVMLVDIEMPRMDGFDLTRNVRADSALANIPIIMITSRIADKHREYAMSLGVNAYMGKPYHDDELLAAIKRLTILASQHV